MLAGDDMSRLRRVAPLSLILFAMIALGHALPTEFLHDAGPVIRDNDRVIGPTGWLEIWTTNYWGDRFYDGLYRPLTLTSYRIEHQLFGFADRASWYGATNLALHVIATLLLWRLAYALMPANRRSVGAWLAGAFFVVHPWATTVVPNLVGRADLLALVGVLMASLCWLRWLDGQAGQRRWLVVALLAWSAALFSKESAAVWPAMLLMIHLVRRDAWQRRHLQAGVAIILVGIMWWAVRSAVLMPIGDPMTNSISNPLVIESADVRVRTGMALMGSYLAQAMLPVHLSADYSYNQYPVVSHWNDGRWLAALGVVVALAWLLPWCLRRASHDGKVHGRIIAGGVIFFLLALLPVSNLLFTIGTIRADRIGYLPLIGLAIAVGSIGSLASKHSRRLVVGVAMVMLLVLTLRTAARAQVWTSGMRFWPAMVVDAPNSVKSNAAIANVWLNMNHPLLLGASLEPARYAWLTATEMPGDDFLFPWISYARALRSNGRSLEALTVLREAQQREDQPSRRRESWLRWQSAQQSNRPYGRVGLALEMGITQRDMGDTVGAVRSFERAVGMDDATGQATYEVARTYAQCGEDELATYWFNLVITRHPQRARFFAGYGRWANERSDYATAASMLSMAIDRGDFSAETYALLKQVYRDWLIETIANGDRVTARKIVERANRRDRIHSITLQSVGLD